MRAVKNFRSGEAIRTGAMSNSRSTTSSAATSDRVVLDPHFEQDDHDNPALLALPDGRMVAVYTRHAVERKVFCRISEPHDPLTWGPVQTIETPGKGCEPYTGDNVTYSNLFRLKSGRIYNFYRGFDYDPNYMFSDDDGQSWQLGGRLVKGPTDTGRTPSTRSTATRPSTLLPPKTIRALRQQLVSRLDSRQAASFVPTARASAR